MKQTPQGGRGVQRAAEGRGGEVASKTGTRKVAGGLLLFGSGKAVVAVAAARAPATSGRRESRRKEIPGGGGGGACGQDTEGTGGPRRALRRGVRRGGWGWAGGPSGDGRSAARQTGGAVPGEGLGVVNAAAGRRPADDDVGPGRAPQRGQQ